MPVELRQVVEQAQTRWAGRVDTIADGSADPAYELKCPPEELAEICDWLFSELHYSFGGLIVEQRTRWTLRYVFYGGQASRLVARSCPAFPYGGSNTQHQYPDSRR